MIAAAIPLCWLKLMALSETNDPVHQFVWTADDQADDNTDEMAAQQSEDTV